MTIIQKGERMSDLISRQAAMERLMAQNVIMDGSEYHNGFNAGVNRAQEVIRNLPPVQPKRGHWMIEPTEEPEYCKCSECGYVNLIVEVFALDGYHYCPNCGAKMERNEDDAD